MIDIGIDIDIIRFIWRLLYSGDSVPGGGGTYIRGFTSVCLLDSKHGRVCRWCLPWHYHKQSGTSHYECHRKRKKNIRERTRTVYATCVLIAIVKNETVRHYLLVGRSVFFWDHLTTFHLELTKSNHMEPSNASKCSRFMLLHAKQTYKTHSLQCQIVQEGWLSPTERESAG